MSWIFSCLRQFLEAFERLHVLKVFDQGFDQISHIMCRKKNDDGVALFHQGVCVYVAS